MTTPSIDPSIRTILERSNDVIFDGDAVFSTTEHFAALRAIAEVAHDPAVDVVDHVTEAGLRLRVYRPTGVATVAPLIVMLHSGGWVHGRPESEEDRALRYSREVGAVVVSVDWRHAPEHPFPAAADDAYAGLLWAVEHAADLRADPERVAVAGCSSGGNLAASTALRARDLGGPSIDFLLLVYAALDDRMTTASAREMSDSPVLTSGALRRAWDYYAPDGSSNGYAAPARAADLSGLPPTLLVVAEVDPLRDENLDFARRLSQSGVSTELAQVPGTVHGFDLLFPGTVAAERARALQTRALREALGGAT